MKNILNIIAKSLLVLFLFVSVGYGLTLLKTDTAQGSVTLVQPQPTSFQEFTFFATTTDQVVTAGTTIFYATTTNATSTNMYSWLGNGRVDNGSFVIAGAKGVSLFFGRGYAGGNSGSSKFNIQASNNGTDWYDYSRLYLTDVARTASSTIWIVAATSTVQADMDLSIGAPYAIRCIAVEATDGAHTCKATARY